MNKSVLLYPRLCLYMHPKLYLYLFIKEGDVVVPWIFSIF